MPYVLLLMAITLPLGIFVLPTPAPSVAEASLLARRLSLSAAFVPALSQGEEVSLTALFQEVCPRGREEITPLDCALWGTEAGAADIAVVATQDALCRVLKSTDADLIFAVYRELVEAGGPCPGLILEPTASTVSWPLRVCTRGHGGSHAAF